MFWFGSASDIDHLDPRESKDYTPRDVFYVNEEASNYEERIRALLPYLEDKFEDPEITENDVAEMEKYMVLHLEVETVEGDFKLIYYENDELVLRGDEALVNDLKQPLEKRLNLDLHRV